MAISDWPTAERPREKLLNQGAQALSAAELLAIFLRIGTKGKSAVDLARHLLNHFGNLNRLFSANLKEFTAIPGIGPAKYVQLQAVLELARRSLHEDMTATGITLSSPLVVRDYLRLSLGSLEHEVFMVLFLDTQNRLLAAEKLFRGTLSQASVYPREIVKLALSHNAAAVLLAHNHPSGFVQASQADIHLTHSLKKILAPIDIKVLDHFIVSGNTQPFSFAEQGLL